MSEPSDLINDIINKVYKAHKAQVILINKSDSILLINYIASKYGFGTNPIALRDNGECTIMGLKCRISEVEEVEVY